ncbi:MULTISPECIES: TRAP transporter substrate-binding protein [Desulfococcus]|uniref:TRAP dicarboxylate transporter, DctP subunit n=2 Tax=Desulfococcus multivorans TaxID=897 RepID=S7TY54_DESML|nr:TRAP transporter substrate-binding protein [Desulfococcus multivorans]AOY57384.1 DctP2: C4-TRAP dicarboxylate transporter periplasmatic binding protein [Desulfococcus multivorans]AQV02846.1 ABC transporter substrate-binding protein [Desulfococcus multivorans]EPR42012.1 TRAP dicarboxylate transporter, DctP subunit [Desulfococcus multivorans DSM 2059]SKA10182.1 tripartite ATP-independent transporter solute receptor, DctP family [Desulfococcus multivorans DSM 2059]
MKRWGGWFAMIAVVFLAVPAMAAMTVKLGVVTKPGSAQNIAAEKFKALVDERTNGEVTVKVFHSASLGNETEILQQIQMGTVEMGVITSGVFDTFDPIVRVIDYPFLFRDDAQADAVLDGPLGAEILTGLEASGFKGLCFSENGFRNLTNSKRPVRTAADVSGLKIRVMDSALHNAIWQSMGANPTPMPWPIYTELEQGVIDGQENPLWVLEVYRFHEIQKYLTLTRHVYSPHIAVASLSWWNRLAPEMQSLLQTAMKAAAVFQRADNRARDADRLRMLEEEGMQIEKRPDIASFREKTDVMREMNLYQDPRVKSLLARMLAATR